MDSTGFLTYVIIILLGGLALLAIVSVLRGFLEAKTMRLKPGPKVAFIDFPPPAPVQPSKGVTQVGWSAAIWSALNLVAAFMWFATGFGLKGIMPQNYLLAAYVVVAALIGGVGGVLLLSCQAQGRRMISWGGFLFAMITTLAFSFSLIEWSSPRTQLSQKSTAMWMALLSGGHLVIDTVIASAAQRVGVAKGAEPDAAETPVEPGK